MLYPSLQTVLIDTPQGQQTRHLAVDSEDGTVKALTATESAAAREHLREEKHKRSARDDASRTPPGPPNPPKPDHHRPVG